MPPEPGPAPFETYRYQYSVVGRYDQLGEFLSDVASLQRIIVPVDLTLSVVDVGKAKALGDSTGSLLEARFQIRTFVKTATPEGRSQWHLIPCGARSWPSCSSPPRVAAARRTMRPMPPLTWRRSAPNATAPGWPIRSSRVTYTDVL